MFLASSKQTKCSYRTLQRGPSRIVCGAPSTTETCSFVCFTDLIGTHPRTQDVHRRFSTLHTIFLQCLTPAVPWSHTEFMEMWAITQLHSLSDAGAASFSDRDLPASVLRTLIFASSFQVPFCDWTEPSSWSYSKYRLIQRLFCP